MVTHPNISYAGFPLPWKEELKYLGLIFSKTNQSNRNIRNLRTKALRKINALKSIAYKTYGPRTTDLINISNNSICSLFFYISSISNKFSETHQKICDTIQTTALRTALSLPIWTPNIILRKIAGQESLSDKIRRLAHQFFIKHVASGSHSPLFRHSTSRSIKLTPKDSETFSRLLSDLNFNQENIIQFPNTLDCLSIKCEIHTNTFSFQNKALAKNLIGFLFEDVIRTNFSNFFIMATDASKSHRTTSIAGISKTNSFAYRIHPINSIFSAEALAMCQALDDLPNGEENILILTDSFSVLQALGNISIKSPKVIIRLAQKIWTRNNLNQNIVFVWTPGHSEILWNEKALARGVTEADLYIEWVSPEDISSQLKARSTQKTCITFRDSKYHESLGDIPSIKALAPWLRNRREEIIISRILSRMIITPALLHKFGLHDNPHCTLCHQDNTIEHILLHCRKYWNVRQRLRLQLNFASYCFSSYKSFLSSICSSCRAIRGFLVFLKHFDIS